MRHDHGFVIQGFVDGRPVTARWSNGVLTADDELRRRAEVIVAMDDDFDLEEPPGHRLGACLDGGITAALLTVLRAFSTVTTIDVDLRPRFERGARSDA